MVYHKDNRSYGTDQDPAGERTPLLIKEDTDGVAYANVCKSKTGPSLYRALLKTYWKQWLLATCMKIIDDFFSIAQPFILRLGHLISHPNNTYNNCFVQKTV